TYRIVARIVSVPEDTFIIEVRYFDRFNELVRTHVLHAPEYEFEYPADCHYYAVRLVNGGCDELRFTSLTLLEAEEDGGQRGEEPAADRARELIPRLHAATV